VPTARHGQGCHWGTLHGDFCGHGEAIGRESVQCGPTKSHSLGVILTPGAFTLVCSWYYGTITISLLALETYASGVACSHALLVPQVWCAHMLSWSLRCGVLTCSLRCGVLYNAWLHLFTVQGVLCRALRSCRQGESCQALQVPCANYQT
jgi:hypothetical protein